MNCRDKTGKFIRLSGNEKQLLLEAAVLLGLARAAVLLVPFRRLAGCLGRHMAESSMTVEAGEKKVAAQVSKAVQTAGRHLPWECTCLVQALAGNIMLKRRRLPHTLYLGVARESDQELSAHAWLRCGDVVVTGGAGRERFTVVSTFAE